MSSHTIFFITEEIFPLNEIIFNYNLSVLNSLRTTLRVRIYFLSKIKVEFLLKNSIWKTKGCVSIAHIIALE